MVSLRGQGGRRNETGVLAPVRHALLRRAAAQFSAVLLCSASPPYLARGLLQQKHTTAKGDTQDEMTTTVYTNSKTNPVTKHQQQKNK